MLLVVSAAIALLVMTRGRCWQATGSPADPTYSVIPAWDLSVSSSTDASVTAAIDAMGAQRVYAVAYTPTTWTESVSAIFASRANATPW